MSLNSFGLIYRFTTYGESHGPEIGVVLDGVPAGLELNLEKIQAELNRRRPGKPLTSQRQEADQAEVVSGLLKGVTTGAPLCFRIPNMDARSTAYEELKEMYRPGHAEYTWEKKYGLHDIAGGGRASARETAGRVIAGAVARQFLSLEGIEVRGNLIEVGGVEEGLESVIEEARRKGDSVGGKVRVEALGVPVGLGEPVYEKLDARIAFAMMSLPAAKAVEIGSGVESSLMAGSSHNDEISPEGFLSNHAGGILGGVSNGMPVVVTVSFKPTASIFLPQKTVNRKNEACILNLKGRHDPCVALRAVPVVEAMLAAVLLDMMLVARTRTI